MAAWHDEVTYNFLLITNRWSVIKVHVQYRLRIFEYLMEAARVLSETNESKESTVEPDECVTRRLLLFFMFATLAKWRDTRCWLSINIHPPSLADNRIECCLCCLLLIIIDAAADKRSRSNVTTDVQDSSSSCCRLLLDATRHQATFNLLILYAVSVIRLIIRPIIIQIVIM